MPEITNEACTCRGTIAVEDRTEMKSLAYTCECGKEFASMRSWVLHYRQGCPVVCAELYNDGLTLAQLADRFDIAESMVRRRLAIGGILLEKRTGKRTGKRTKSTSAFESQSRGSNHEEC